MFLPNDRMQLTGPASRLFEVQRLQPARRFILAFGSVKLTFQVSFVRVLFMRVIASAVVGLFCLSCLASCSKAPVYSSDGAIKDYVQAQLSAKWPNAKLSGFQVGELKSEGDIDKREYSASIQSSDPTDPRKITGHMGYNKKSGERIYNWNFEYAK